MIEIVEAGGLESGRVALGTACSFRILHRRPRVSTRSYLSHERVFCAKPVSDWTSEELVVLFPEAPGTYHLEVHWLHEPDGQTGWERFSFKAGEGRVKFSPTFFKSPAGERFWAPNQLEASNIQDYESGLIQQIDQWLSPGDVVFDVGANIGLYSVPMAKRVGAKGRVLCFEPNPVCVSFLQANLEENDCDNARILPLAVTDGADSVDFTISYANSLTGVSARSSFYGYKSGQEIRVAGDALDAMIETYHLPDPDVIKLDIEGAEVSALPGLGKTLERLKPLLLFEVHGPEIAAVVLPMLDYQGYSYEDAQSGRRYEQGSQLLAAFGTGVRQLLCRPR